MAPVTILQRLPSKDTTRANYQACIWRCSLQCSPSILEPVGFRWKMGSSAEDESSLPFDWMDGKPAPDAVLERLACRCPRSFRLSDCVCMANALTCTQTCVDCRIQTVQGNVKVIVDGHSGEEDEGGY